MESNETKTCPFCTESIQTEAIKCRYCGSMLSGRQESTGFWYRVNEGKRIAGVCTGIAREFNSEKLILPLRVFFIMSIFLSGFGLIVYTVLWIIMPAPIDHPAPVAGHKNGSASVLAGTESHETLPFIKRRSHNPVLGLILIMFGIVLIFWLFTGGNGFHLPFIGNFHIPLFSSPLHFPGGAVSLFNWTPGFLTIMVIAGLFIVVLGGLRFFRFLIGCGLAFFGSFLIILFVSLTSSIALFPVVLVIGSALIILGGIMFVAGLIRR